MTSPTMIFSRRFIGRRVEKQVAFRVPFRSLEGRNFRAPIGNPRSSIHGEKGGGLKIVPKAEPPAEPIYDRPDRRVKEDGLKERASQLPPRLLLSPLRSPQSRQRSTDG